MTDREQFLAERRTGLGASDMGAVLGLDPYRTPFQVWQEKTGRIPPFDGNLATRTGAWLEEFIAQEYCRETGQRVQRWTACLRHPTAPLLAHPDRLVIPAGQYRAHIRNQVRTDKGLECKHTSVYAAGAQSEWGAAGSDQIPARFLLQCAQNMALANVPHWDLAVLIGNGEFRVYHLHRDAELEDLLIEEGSRWWRDHVVADIPPDPRSEGEARQRWPQHRTGQTLTLDDAAWGDFQDYRQLKGEMAALEERLTALKDRLYPAFQDADTLLDPDGRPIATYRAARDSRHTQWQALAGDLLGRVYPDEGEKAAAIARFTSTHPGARSLRLLKPTEQP